MCVEVSLVEGVCVCARARVHMCMHVLVWYLQCVIRHVCMCVNRGCTMWGRYVCTSVITTFLTLQLFNTVPYVVVTPNHKIISLLL